MPATTRSPALVATPAKRLSAAAVTVLVALMVLAGAAGAQDYPPRAVISVATPGATITIESPNADWGPGTQVRIDYETPSGAQVTRAAAVNEDGTFATDFEIPEDAETGVSELTVSGVDANGQEQRWEPEVLVQAEEPTAAGPSADGGTEVAQADDPVAAGPSADGTQVAQAGDAEEADEVRSASGLPSTGNTTAAWALAAVLLVAMGSASVMGAQILTARRDGLDS